MESAKTFKKLPSGAREILIKFKSDGDRDALFSGIRGSVLMQNTEASKHTRQSTFRGLLRTYFNMSNEDMSPIEFTTEEKQGYHELNKQGSERRHEDVIDLALFKAILNVSDWTYLMCTSGLRLNELHDGVDIRGGDVWATLSKKAEDITVKIHIIGDIPLWIAKYNALDRSVALTAVNVKINRYLKKIMPSTMYKTSSHICRALYARYLVDFDKSNDTQSNIMKKYLHHESSKTTVYYDHVRFADDVTDFLRVEAGKPSASDLEKMTAPQIAVLVTDNKLIGRSKLRTKAQRIAALLAHWDK